MVPSPTERILRLAAYLDEHRRDDITISEISLDIDGYDEDRAAPRDEWHRLIPRTPGWEKIRRKVKRDLDDLRDQWGIDVEYDEQEHTYRLAPPFLSARERAELISAAGVVAVEGLHAEEPGAIGSKVDDALARVVVQVHASVAALRDAIESRTPVRFRHEGRERVLEPWALGVWRNQWYVAGGDPARDGEMRRFRLDRVEPVAPGGALEGAGPPGSYDIPEWFDVDRAFDFDPNSWGHDPAVEVRVRVEPDHVARFVAEFGGAAEPTDEPATTVTVVLTVRHHESFRNRLLGLRGHAVVESPAEMVALVREHLAAVAARSAAPGEAG